jgi:hypothetical protein
MALPVDVWQEDAMMVEKVVYLRAFRLHDVKRHCEKITSECQSLQ